MFEMDEDIFKENFMRAIVTIRLGRYSDSVKFSGWLRLIAHNLIIDSYRQDKNENLISCDEPDINILNNACLSEGTIENSIVNHQILSDFRKLVDFLRDEQ